MSAVRRSALIVLVLAVGLALLPAAAGAHTPATVPGRLAHGKMKLDDGIKIFLRYQNDKSLYAVYVNRRDGDIGVQRKIGDGESSADYRSIGPRPLPKLPPAYGQKQTIRASAVNEANGNVTIRLWVDGQLVYTAVDTQSPIRTAGRVGLRADNVELFFDDYAVHQATSSGLPTGDPLVRDNFSYPNGLVTNQRDRSAQNRTFQVTSGSLFAKDGRAHSGLPDNLYPNPESRWGTNSSIFRMVTRRADLLNVAVSLDLWNVGYVTPGLEGPAATPPAYPTGGGAVTVQRLQGRSKVHTTIAVSKRAFSTAPAVVLTDANPTAATLSAPALAGKVGGPLLITGKDALHADTAAEIRRLRATTAWLVGPLSSRLDAQLQAAGITSVRRLSGSTQPDTAARVARAVRGARVYLAVSEVWNDAVGFSGASARLKRPVLLTARNELPAVTLKAITDLGVTHVTVLGTDINPKIVQQLRDRRIAVDHAGFSRYGISRASAEQQVRAGATPGRIWLAAGARPGDALAGGAAAAREGGVLLTVDGANLGPIDHANLRTHGFESRHWQRYNRTNLGTLRVIGDTLSVSDTVVKAATAKVDRARP
jgi:hypothetical protein